MTRTVRLNKFLADCGISSRRKVEEFITQGRVIVNDKTINNFAYYVNPTKDVVTLDGERLKPIKHIYILLNKPKGYITTTSDEIGRKTVLDLVPINYKIFPVGRLDYSTSGVLLLTNDGDFAQLLLHPSNEIPREYEVKLDRPLKYEDEKKLLNGVFIKGIKGNFTKIFFPTKDKKFVQVTTVEGRNHFVKNMFKSAGYNVIDLHRKSFAGITVDNLPIGKYRILSYKEVSEVFKNYAK